MSAARLPVLPLEVSPPTTLKRHYAHRLDATTTPSTITIIDVVFIIIKFNLRLTIATSSWVLLKKLENISPSQGLNEVSLG